MKLRGMPGVGIGHETCAAGVNYAQAFDRSKPGIENRTPCSPPIVPGREQMLCPIDGFVAKGIEAATREHDEREALFEAVMRRVTKAIEAIDATGNGPRSGVIACPTCHSDLHYSIASNGHRVARCDTPDCVSFIE
jgi:hypothetical protein